MFHRVMRRADRHTSFLLLLGLLLLHVHGREGHSEAIVFDVCVFDDITDESYIWVCSGQLIELSLADASREVQEDSFYSRRELSEGDQRLFSDVLEVVELDELDVGDYLEEFRQLAVCEVRETA